MLPGALDGCLRHRSAARLNRVSDTDATGRRGDVGDLRWPTCSSPTRAATSPSSSGSARRSRAVTRTSGSTARTSARRSCGAARSSSGSRARTSSPSSSAPTRFGRSRAGASASTRKRRNKRIVPLLRREPDGIAVPDELASRNYIYFRTDEEFAPGVASVLAAIDDLPEWAREHTRLLERAEEWEHSGQDPSFLLRGSDLSEAEAWLSSQGEHKEPRPTPLQTEYLLAGRKAATRRQRRTIAAVALALAVSVVLGGVALLQRDEAQEQRDEAIRQARLAESRELAATSVRRRPDGPLGSPPSSLSAPRKPPRHRRPPRRSVAPWRPTVRAPCSRCRMTLITSARFAGDSAHVLTSGFDRRVRRWDLATGEHEIVGMRPPYVWTQGRAALTTASGLRVTARPAGVRVTEAATGAVLIETRPTRTRNRGNDSGRGRQSRWKLDSDRRLRRDGSGLAAQVEGAASEASRRGCDQPGRGTLPDDQPRWRNDDVVLRHRRGTAGADSSGRLWNRGLSSAQRSRRSATLRQSSAPTGRRSWSGPGVTRSSSTPRAVTSGLGFPRSRGRGSSPSVSPSGSLGLRALSRRHAELVELPEERRIRTVAAYFPFGGYRVAYSDDDRRVAISADPEPIVRVYDLETTDELPPIGPFEGPILAADLSGDGSLVVTATGTEAQLWNASTGERVGAGARGEPRRHGGLRRGRTLPGHGGERRRHPRLGGSDPSAESPATRLIRGWTRRGSAAVGDSSSWARAGRRSPSTAPPATRRRSYSLRPGRRSRLGRPRWTPRPARLRRRLGPRRHPGDEDHLVAGDVDGRLAHELDRRPLWSQ